MELKNMTATELKNELYIATLIEMHQKDELWLTKTMKDAYEEDMKSARFNFKDVQKCLESASNRLFLKYKEKDLLLYLLLKTTIANTESPQLNNQELSCAKSMIVGEIEYTPEQISIECLVRRFKDQSKKIVLNDVVKKMIVRVCNNGEHCFEPYSMILDYSEKLATSLENMVITKCLYHGILPINHDINDNNDGEALTEQCKVHLLNGENKKVSFPDIWQYASEDKYWSVLISHFPIFVSDISFLDSISDHLLEDGKIVVIWDNSYIKKLFSLDKQVREKFDNLKKRLASHQELDAYIPSEDIEIYILRKGKKDKDVNVFYSIENGEIVGNYGHTIRKQLQVKRMTQRDLDALGYDLSKVNLIPTIPVNEGETYRHISDLLAVSKDEHVRFKQTAFGRVFTKDNYATSYDTFVVSPSSLREAQVDDNWKKVSEPVFVIRKEPFAVAYVEASESTPVYFKDLEMTFSVKNDVVNPMYLYYMSTNGKLEHVVRICPSWFLHIGDYVLYKDEQNHEWIGEWPAKALLSYDKALIAIPSLTRQREECAFAEKAERSRIDRAAMAQYREDIHQRKHTLGQIMLNMRSCWDALNFAKRENNGCLSDDYVYGKKHPHSVKSIFESLESYINELGDGIESFTPEDNPIYEKKEQIFIKEYLEDFVKRHWNSCYDFEIAPSGTSSENSSIVFSKKALDTIFQNIVFNAWEYGFKEREHGNIIRISWEENDDMLQILVSNNGSPIDESMISNNNLFKYGKSSSRGKDSVDGFHHKGLGCYQIWCLMRDKGQGDVQCISEPENEFPVTFKLVFNK